MTPILGIIASGVQVSSQAAVLLSTAGQVYTSADLETWTFKGQVGGNYGVTSKFHYLSEANGFLYANEVNSPLNWVAKSTDGISWSGANIANTYAAPLLYANSKYLGIASYYFGYSTDGVSWSFGDKLTSGAWDLGGPPLAFGNSTYVTVDSGAEPVLISTSTNGTTWTSRTAAHSGVTYWGVAYGNSTFVAVGAGTNNSGRIATSTDGITWTSRTPLETANNSALYCITYGGGNFVVNAYVSNKAQYSTDGITWTNTASLGSTFKLSYLTYGNGYYVGADQSASSGGLLWYSTDAITWSSVVPNTTSDYVHGIVYSSTTSKWHIALDLKTYGYSTNLTSWTVGDDTNAGQPATNIAMYSIYYNSAAPLYLIGGNSGLFFTSTDAITWTSRTTNTSTNRLNKIVYDSTNYIVAGANSALAVSTDGITWTSRTTNFGSNINGLDYTSATTEKYAICGPGGRISSSTDNITWTTRTSEFGTTTVNEIKYLNNLWIAVGTNGKISTSTDAITWTSRTSNLTSTLKDIAYNTGVYVVVSSSGGITTSTDGTTWTSRTSTITEDTTSVVYANNNFYAFSIGVAGRGPMLSQYSSNGITWTSRELPSIYNREPIAESGVLSA